MTKKDLFNLDKEKYNEIFIENLQNVIERCVEAEMFISEYINSSWYKRLFYKNKAISFLINRLVKYRF